MPLEVALVEKSDLDKLEFEPPELDRRYTGMLELIGRVQQMKHNPYIFIKVGGPYLRSSFLRGEFQWYIDIGEDPEFAAAVAKRVTDHLIAVGIEALKRSELSDTSVWIFDDIASNQGLLISPQSYERLFLPQVRRMVAAFKQAGAAHVGYHSDGDIRSVLDGLVDAGISILNPVEPRANMDVVELRLRYGKRLAFVGGLCNSLVLPNGSDREVCEHVEHVLSIADDGGLVIGSHSISNDVTQERYNLFMEILHEHGRPRPGWSH
jgi:uroporphyrinogen decarboxylase